MCDNQQATDTTLSSSPIRQPTTSNTDISKSTSPRRTNSRHVNQHVDAIASVSRRGMLTAAGAGLIGILTGTAQSAAGKSGFPGPGSGTPDDPYQIENWTHLDAIREEKDAIYKLAADLDESTTGYDSVVATRSAFTDEFPPGQVGTGETVTLRYAPIKSIDNADADVMIIDAEEGMIEWQEDPPSGLTSVQVNYTTTDDITVGMEPIGDYSSFAAFTGMFDGQRHTIADLTIKRPAMSEVGLFNAENSIIRNIDLRNVSITGGTNVGGVAGIVADTIVENITISGSVTGTQNAGGVIGDIIFSDITAIEADVTVRAVSQPNRRRFDLIRIGGLAGNITESSLSDVESRGNISVAQEADSPDQVAGLLGQANAVTVTRAVTSGSVTVPQEANDIGGLIGYSDAVTPSGSETEVSQSYAAGDITAPEATNVGGFIGYNGGASGDQKPITIADTYATGAVSGKSNVGGLIGDNSEAAGTVEVRRSYAVGAVSATGSDPAVGGVIGTNEGGASVINCYWDNTASGTQQNSSAGLPDENGLMTANMQGKQASDTLMFSFADPNIWETVAANDELDPIPTEPGYPILANVDMASQLDTQGVATVSISDYTNSNNIVDTPGLLAAIDDWRANKINVTLLLKVIDAWRSGDSVA